MTEKKLICIIIIGEIYLNNIDIPKVTLHNIDKKSYIKLLAETESQISVYKNVVRYGISNTIKQIFNINGDCFSIFDKRAGGVLFKDWEWELIPNSNQLKKLFESQKSNQYLYCLETDEGKMLRGADTYYYFLTNKKKSQNVNNKMVYEWTQNNIKFLRSLINILSNMKKIDVYDRRLLLGGMDNARNIALIMLNVNIVKYSNKQSSLLGLSLNTENPDIYKWSLTCQEIEKNMKILCFSSEIDDIFLNNVYQSLDTILKNLVTDIKNIINKPNEINLDKAFRSYREIDNFIENYIAINYALQKIKESNTEILNRQINFIGATYGGLELPFIANEILNNEILMSAIVLQSKYKDRTAQDFLSKPLNILNLNKFNTFNILGDDNVLTRKTLQSIINLLFTNNIAVNNIAIVRYPSINRLNQMLAEDSAVDLTKFFDYIQGLVFSSPYTKINGNKKDLYLDKLGIFNKDRRRLLEYLYKNGRYSENSEVAEIEKMYERR